MISPNSKSPQQVALLAGTGLLVVAFLFVLVQVVAPIGKKPFKTYSEGYAEGYQAARDSALQAAPGIRMEGSSLTGTVTSINGNKVTFDARGVMTDSRAGGVGISRTATLRADGTVVRTVVATDQEFKKKMDAYLKNPSPDTTAPSPMKEEVMAISDIKIGDSITVFAAKEENIVLLASFEIKKIIVSPKMQPVIDPNMSPDAVDGLSPRQEVPPVVGEEASASNNLGPRESQPATNGASLQENLGPRSQ